MFRAPRLANRLIDARRFACALPFLVGAVAAAQSRGQTAVPHRAPHVPWLDDPPWTEVLQEAAATSRPILVDFHASWCGPCKAMDALVYNEAEVIRELADVLTVKVDVDKPEADALEREFGVTRLPTLVYCDPTGKAWGSFTGFVTRDTFLVRVRRWRHSLADEEEFRTRLAAAPDDPALLAEAFRRRRQRGQDAEAATIPEELLRQTDDLRRAAAATALVSVARQEEDADSSADAVALARRIERMFPADGLDLDRKVRGDDLAALGDLAALQSQLPDTLGLLETYSRMIKLDRGCMPALEGFARTALAAGIRLPQATTCALRAVIRSDERPDLVALLAACYQRRSFHARAVKWMEKAVDGEPGNPDFRQTLARYRETCPAWMLEP